MKKSIFTVMSLLSCIQMCANDIDWSYPPTTLSTIAVNATDPQITMDEGGDVVSVWIEAGIIQSKTKLFNQSWGPTEIVSSTNASMPRLVSDKNGNATLVWLEGTIVKAATKTLSGSWSSPISLSSSGASTPAIGIDGAGNIIAAWARNGDIETSTKLFGAGWGVRVVINGTNSTKPSVALGGSGTTARAIVVWEGTSQGSEVVFASTKTLTSNWSPRLILSDMTKGAKNADAAVDSKGNTIAVWFEYDQTGSSYYNVRLKSAQKNIDENWSCLGSISQPGMRNPSSLVAKISYDANGNAIVLWTTSFDNARYNIQSAVKPVREAWGAPVTLVSENLYSYDADLAVSSLGDVSSVYMFYNGAALQIQSTIADISGFIDNTWSIPRNIYSNMNNAYPKIAATLSNNSIQTAAVWLSNSGSNNEVLASTGSRAVVLPPTNLVVSQAAQNYGVFTEYANTVTWTASLDPETVGYLIFRNGEWIGKVGANITSFVDHNRTQSGSVTYGVSSFNKENSHSNIINVTFP